MNIKRLVSKLPAPIRQSVKYLYGNVPPRIRYGRVFWETYNFLQQSQWWSQEEWEEYQRQQLTQLIRHSYENVPYYRQIFEERGLRPKDIQSLDDLKKLPFLTKEIIRKNSDQLIARNISRSEMEVVRTSGSTGAPLSIYYEKGKTDLVENAFVHALWCRVGYRSRWKRVNLTWELVSKGDSWWEYNPAQKILTLSPYHMNEENLGNYVEKMRRFKPEAIKSIPSAIIVLADFMRRHQVSPFPSVKLILLGSEMLFPWQRRRIREVFHSRIFSWYGQAEQVILAGECEQNNEYHIVPEYGITELIGADGEQIKQEGVRGVLVGTGFNNYAMPFIRYKTDDLAFWSNKKCSCERNCPLLEKIEGRDQEFIVLRDGHLVPLLALPFSSVLSKAIQFQFYQDKPGEVILKIVKMQGLEQNNSKSVQKKLSEGLGHLKIKFEFVDSIPRTDRGKFKYMIQKIPIKFETFSD